MASHELRGPRAGNMRMRARVHTHTLAHTLTLTDDACQPVITSVGVFGTLRLAVCAKHADHAVSWLTEQVSLCYVLRNTKHWCAQSLYLAGNWACVVCSARNVCLCPTEQVGGCYAWCKPCHSCQSNACIVNLEYTLSSYCIYVILNPADADVCIAKNCKFCIYTQQALYLLTGRSSLLTYSSLGHANQNLHDVCALHQQALKCHAKCLCYSNPNPSITL